MRKLLVAMLVLASQSVSQETDCEVNLPIESAKDTECIVNWHIERQSCFSTFGYTREISESFSRWEVVVRDLNPIPNKGCATLRLAICKISGEVLYSPSSDECPNEKVVGLRLPPAAAIGCGFNRKCLG